MNMKDIIILTIYGYILFFVLKKQQVTEMILLTGAAYLLITGNVFEGFENDSTEVLDGSDSDIQSNLVPNKSGKLPTITNEPLNMGPYDGICLKTGNKDYWMKSPDESALITNDQLFSYLGSQGPLKMRLSDQAALIGPPIDGVKGSPEKKFMFANNITSPACCPSTFSTSTGCVCTTQNQRDFIAARGILGEESVNNNNAEL